MKRKLSIFIFFILLLAVVLSVGVYAEEMTTAQGENIQAYIEEKIIPVIMGVATSVIALLGTLKGIFNALKGLKESKANFDKEQATIRENSKKELEEIKLKYDEIKASVENVPQLDTQIKELNKQASRLALEIANLSEIASLGFSKESELVSTGKSREIVRLANKNKELISGETI